MAQGGPGRARASGSHTEPPGGYFLMASVLTEIVDYLAGSGVLNLTAGTNIFESILPDTPSAAVAVLETGGAAPDRQLGSEAALFEFPSIQILFRGNPNDYGTPRAQALVAWTKLLEINPQDTLGGVAYQFVSPIQSPYEMGRDSKERVIISFNCSVQKDPS